MRKNKYLSPEHELYIKRERNRKIFIVSTQIGILVLFLAFWELAAQLHWIDSFLMSCPSRIWLTLADLYNSGDLFYHIWVSLYETLLGFAIGTVAGTVIAVLL